MSYLSINSLITNHKIDLIFLSIQSIISTRWRLYYKFDLQRTRVTRDVTSKIGRIPHHWIFVLSVPCSFLLCTSCFLFNVPARYTLEDLWQILRTEDILLLARASALLFSSFRLVAENDRGRKVRPRKTYVNSMYILLCLTLHPRLRQT